MHENLDEFELLPDPTTDRSNLPLSAKQSTYYLVATLAPSFLIGSSSFFSGKEDNHKVWTEYEFRVDQTNAAELAALE